MHGAGELDDRFDPAAPHLISTRAANAVPGGGGTAFSDAAQADIERAAAVGVDEMHISLNLGTPVHPDRQAELSEAPAERCREDSVRIPLGSRRAW